MRSVLRFLISKITTVSQVFAFTFAGLLLACSSPNHLPVDAHPSSSPSVATPSESLVADALPLRVLADIPLTGGTTRLDYQSLDSATGRLYIAHLGSDLMTAFDVNKQTLVGDVKE